MVEVYTRFVVCFLLGCISIGSGRLTTSCIAPWSGSVTPDLESSDDYDEDSYSSVYAGYTTDNTGSYDGTDADATEGTDGGFDAEEDDQFDDEEGGEEGAQSDEEGDGEEGDEAQEHGFHDQE